MKMKKIKYEYIVLGIFLLGLYLRIGLNGIYDYPGNCKAADCMGHSLVADNIYETEQHKYLPPSLAQGHSDILNSMAIQIHLRISSVKAITGIEEWNLFNMFSFLYNALIILVLFELGKTAFKSKTAGLFASALYFLPYPFHIWGYNAYIGMAPQACGFLYLLSSIWLALDYLREPKDWKLIGLAIAISEIMLSHISELIPLTGVMIYFGIRVMMKEKDLKKVFMIAFKLSILPIICFLIFYPKLVTVWSGMIKIGIHTPGFGDTVSGYYFPKFTDFPIAILILAGIGLISILMNHKKYKDWILVTIWTLGYFFIVPFFVDAHYIMRHHTALPFIIFPLTGLIIAEIIRASEKLLKKKTPKYAEITSLVLVIAVCIGIGYASIPEYKGLRASLNRSMVVNKPMYELMIQFEEMYPEHGDVFILNGYMQNAPIYMRKNGVFVVDPQEMYTIANNANLNKTTEIFKGEWAGTAYYFKMYHDNSFFDIRPDHHEIKENTQNILDFDHVFMVNLNENYAMVNSIIANQLSQEGYGLLYNENGLILMGREK